MALSVAALGIYVAYEGATGADNPGYAEVGPGAFPIAIGVTLVVAGVALLLQALRGEWHVAWVDRAPTSVHSRESGNPGPQAESSQSVVLGPRFRGDERRSSSPLLNVFLVATALVLDVILMPSLGFVAASAAMFALVAAAFGSRRFILDAALGLAFGTAIYLVFVHGLGLHLPVGTIWEGVPWTR